MKGFDSHLLYTSALTITSGGKGAPVSAADPFLTTTPQLSPAAPTHHLYDSDLYTVLLLAITITNCSYLDRCI